jgi:hypothetical protein
MRTGEIAREDEFNARPTHCFRSANEGLSGFVIENRLIQSVLQNQRPWLLRNARVCRVLDRACVATIAERITHNSVTFGAIYFRKQLFSASLIAVCSVNYDLMRNEVIILFASVPH